ncbi:hypothetical protein VTN96DRAFT_1818 [Rasamsonia emersonii]
MFSKTFLIAATATLLLPATLALPPQQPPSTNLSTHQTSPIRGSISISLSQRDTCGSCHTCGNGQKICGLCNSGACSVCLDGKDCVTHESLDGWHPCPNKTS